MRGVVFLGDRQLELREFPDPTPGPGEVVLESGGTYTTRLLPGFTLVLDRRK